jgi:hypothetical protein
MSKKSRYKGLLLNRENLPQWIEEFADETFTNSDVSEINQISGTHHKCIITGDDKEIILDIYFSNDGKTTISPAAGQHQDIKTELAEFILNRLQFKNADIKSRSFSIKHLEREMFDDLIEYLLQLPGVSQTNQKRNEVNRSELWQFSSKIGDRITLIYYDKKTLQIQGKPLYLYQEVTIFLSAFSDFDEVIKNQQEYFNVEISPREVKDKMKESLPSAYNILGDNLKKILAGSLTLQKVDLPFDDFSPVAFPALKALEGYLKGILLKYDINVVSNFGGIFKPEGNKHVLNAKTREKIGNNITISVAELLYDFLKKHRHTLFHASGIDADIRIIETKQEADSIIEDVLSLIETTHQDLLAVSK